MQAHMERAAAGFVVVGGLLAALLALAAHALAHAVLLDSEPGADEVVEGAPEEIVLMFNEPMQAPATIVVTGPDDEPVGEDDEAAEIDGERVRRAVEGLTADGAYTVEWRAVSADDHPISGEFTFEVVDAADEPEPTPAERATPEAPTPEPTEPATPDATSTPEEATAEEPPAAAQEAGGVGTLGWLLGAAAVVAALATGAAVHASRNPPSE